MAKKKHPVNSVKPSERAHTMLLRTVAAHITKTGRRITYSEIVDEWLDAWETLNRGEVSQDAAKDLVLRRHPIDDSLTPMNQDEREAIEHLLCILRSHCHDARAGITANLVALRNLAEREDEFRDSSVGRAGLARAETPANGATGTEDSRPGSRRAASGGKRKIG